MNIHGALTQVDVMFQNNPEPALLLESTAGFATLTFAPLPMGSATPTGLANNATAYTASIDVDAPGGPVAISAAGSTMQTFATLVSVLGTALGGVATVGLVGDVVITSVTTGNASTVEVTDGTLFSSVKGSNFRLQANVTTRGHDKYLRWEALDTLEKNELYAVMKVVSSDAVDWTFATAGVLIDDATTAIEVTTALTGLAAGTYSLAVTVDGVTKQVAFTVALNSTVTAAFTSFKAAMLVAFPAATVTMVDGTNVVSFMVTTSTPGVDGGVTVADGTTLGFVAAVAALGLADATAVITTTAGAAGTPGTFDGGAYANWFRALNTAKAPNGFPVLTSVGPVAVIERENKPTKRYIPRADGTYWSGAAWVVWTA
jgi:hypothetical protein